MRRDTFADWFFNRLATGRTPGLIFLALYGAWLIAIGVRGAIFERRFMTRELP